MSVAVRRQSHGIKAVTQAITLPGSDMARLKREASEQGITVSRHVVNLIRVAWNKDNALSRQSLPEGADEAVA